VSGGDGGGDRGAVLRLGFAGCCGGSANDLLQGIEDVRWAAGTPPRPRVDGGRGWWGDVGTERRTRRAGTGGAVDGAGTGGARRKKGPRGRKSSLKQNA
jgi:hypothetical protein